MEVFANLNDLYLATIMIFGLYSTVVTITILVLYMQFMGESTTSTAPTASMVRQIASLDLLLATPNVDAHLDLTTTCVDTYDPRGHEPRGHAPDGRHSDPTASGTTSGDSDRIRGAAAASTYGG